ncbi:MAG: glycosyltransferase family 39 protein [Chloroflexota bacterium]
MRLYHLSFQSLWWDEGISLYLASLDISSLLWNKDFALDLHPPLYHIALSVWTAAVGADTFAARSFSALAGTLNVPLLYVVAARLADRRVGIGAAWLLAVSPLSIYYSQELRMYALMPLLATASMYAFLRILQSPNGRASSFAVACYALSTAAGLWTYYYLALQVVVQNVFFGLWWLWRRTGIRPWLSGQVCAVVLFVPWLLFAGTSLIGSPDLQVSGDAYGWGEVGHFARVFAAAFSVGFDAVTPWSDWAAIGFYILAVLGLLVRQERFSGGNVLVVLWLLVPPLLAFAIATQRAFLFPRFVLFSAFALYVLAGGGLAWLWRRTWILGLLALTLVTAASALGLSHHYTVPRTAYASSDYLPLVARLRVLAEPSDLVLANQAWGAGYARAYLPDPAPTVGWSQPDWSADPERARQAATALLERHGRTWLLSWCEDRRCPPDPLAVSLGEVGTRRYTEQVGEFTLRLFSASGLSAVSSPLSNRGESFAGTIALDGALVTSGNVLRPGQTVSVQAFWRAQTAPAADYTVFAQMLGPDGRVYGQQDSQPLGGTQPTSGWRVGEVTVDNYAFELAPGAPEGPYRLIMGWYEAKTGTRLQVGGGDFVEVGRFELKRQ